MYREDLFKLDSCSGSPPTAKWPVFHSPFRLDNWKYAFVSYIQMGLTRGFHIGFDRATSSLKSRRKNHPSAAANPAVVSQYIQSELELGRLVGPIPEGLVPLVQVSPIGLIPKVHQANKWGMIVDLSFPHHHSVNAGISEDLVSLTYAHMDEAVARIRELGPGTELIKMDLESAYRQVPIHPEDHHLLGIAWNGKTYVCRPRSAIWATVST